MIHGLRPKLAEAGKIKIGTLGEERPIRGTDRKFRLPVKQDHFTITRSIRGTDGILLADQALMDALPKDKDGKCRAIPIVLHSDLIEEVFPHEYAMYSGKSLACRGDGQRATRWAFDRETKQRLDKTTEIACPCTFLGAKGKLTCKPHGRLYCSIAVPGAAIAGAVHVWRTTSIISIEQMLGSLLQIRSLVGALRGVPLTLRVLPLQVAPEGKPTTVYVCHVELRASDLVEVQRSVLERRKMEVALNGKTAVPRLAIAGLEEEPEDEQHEVASEFYAQEAPAEDDEEMAELYDAPPPDDQPGDDMADAPDVQAGSLASRIRAGLANQEDDLP